MLLSANPRNSKLNKIKIVASFAGLLDSIKTSTEIPQGFAATAISKSQSYDDGPILTTESGFVFYSNAIVRYISRESENQELWGQTYFESSQIDQWIDFSLNEIDLAACAWLYPIWGFSPENVQTTAQAKIDLTNVLSILNSHLTSQTFLVGERLTLADIVVAASLHSLYTTVFDAAFRNAFVNTNRWFTTIVNQEQFKAVTGETKFCDKPQSAKYVCPKRESGDRSESKKSGAKKSEAKKPEAKKTEAKKPEAKKPEEKKAEAPVKKDKKADNQVTGIKISDIKSSVDVAGKKVDSITVDSTSPITSTLVRLLNLTSTQGSTTSVKLTDGTVFNGDISAARILARIHSDSDFYGEDALAGAEVDQFLGELSTLTAASVNSHLTLRTFVAGYRLTIADIAVYSKLSQAENLGENQHLKRWFEYVKSLIH